MSRQTHNLYLCIEKFIEALHRYQAATLKINQVAQHQIQASRLIGKKAKAIASTLRA